MTHVRLGWMRISMKQTNNSEHLFIDIRLIVYKMKMLKIMKGRYFFKRS